MVMVKYSILIPVYNGAKYIEKCLDSALEQDYKNYEVIVINDGSTDETEDIIKKYHSPKLRYYYQDNEGVSNTRNKAVSYAKGEFFTFLDSDDYLTKDALTIIDAKIDSDIDLLSFNICVVNKYKEPIYHVQKPVFSNLNGEQAIKKFIEKTQLFDTPVSYIYRTAYFRENKFLYAPNRVHEDFGLTPLVILNAKQVMAIGHTLYYYVITDRSLTRSNNPIEIKQRAWDMLYHFDYLYLNINNNLQIAEKTKKILNNFIALELLKKIKELKGKVLKEYLYEIKNRKILKLINQKGLKNKLLIMLTSIAPKIGSKVILRKK